MLKFDRFHSHKWIDLLVERSHKLNKAFELLSSSDLESAVKIVYEIFYGSRGSRSSDPGMLGSLLYHMAMATKMAAEREIINEAFNLAIGEVEALVEEYYVDFLDDVKHLIEEHLPQLPAEPSLPKKPLTSEVKMEVAFELLQKLAHMEADLSYWRNEAKPRFESLFNEWAQKIVEFRLLQERETIGGFLTAWFAAKKYGVRAVESVMENAKGMFGRRTVETAVEVSLKVGLKRDELDRLMLADHYIERTINMKALNGNMRFLNCPVYEARRYLASCVEAAQPIALLFCRHFCLSHAEAMLNMVMPFPFTITHSKIMAKDGVCEFHLKIAGENAEGFVPLVISWNVTSKCNLKCPHCYLNSSSEVSPDELSTHEAKMLMDQIAEVSRPLLIFSGGEPLLRFDIYDLIQYGKSKGFKVGVGSNGTLINREAAWKLAEAGVDTVSISLDSAHPEKHDVFRGFKGAWEKAVNAIKELRANGILVQVNTVVTMENKDEISQIMDLAEKLGVENFHLFFLVPTGRAVKMEDITPEMYEAIIRQTLENPCKRGLNVKFSCAPQYMRILHETCGQMRHMQAGMRGCMAGLYYCRICPTGDVTPCPYLPINLGNVREKTFSEIWRSSKVLSDLRDPDKLKGKCGRCRYRHVCGGCRARAYGFSSNIMEQCGGFQKPAEPSGDYLAEDPWCAYKP
ncbi:MAG: radical SAM protein [Candidatus Bathyarchaeota archaeon]|nr:radical SAM protein [Candidatus Bathyarchaeota archaeon]